MRVHWGSAVEHRRPPPSRHRIGDALPIALGMPSEPTVTKKRLGLGAWLSIAWLVFIGLSALLAPILPIADPNESNVDIVRKGPFDGSFLGGDGNGQDVFAAVHLGRSGLADRRDRGDHPRAAHRRDPRSHRRLLQGPDRHHPHEQLRHPPGAPALVLALTLIAVLSPNSLDNPPTSFERLRALILTLGIVSIPVLARITRANTLAWSQREFVMAARAMGAKDRRIIVREVLPNVLPAMFSIALLGVAVVIVAEGGLALLGLERAATRRVVGQRSSPPARAACSRHRGSCSRRRSSSSSRCSRSTTSVTSCARGSTSAGASL